MKTLLALLLLAMAGGAVAETAPTEFVTQILEPTGGSIQKPKDWFFSEDHHGRHLTWTVSKEDSRGGKKYETGLKIQMLVDVKQGTGKTPQEFLQTFIESKKKTADKVLRNCEPKAEGDFTRICLETEEGPYHILYTLSWMTGGTDIVAVTIAGAPKELWDVYAPTFDQMASFTLIDMKHLEQKTEEDKKAEKKAIPGPGK